VLVAKLENVKAGRNNLLVEVVFSLWFRFLLLYRVKHSAMESIEICADL
jgi:hypothetical protein